MHDASKNASLDYTIHLLVRLYSVIYFFFLNNPIHYKSLIIFKRKIISVVLNVRYGNNARIDIILKRRKKKIHSDHFNHIKTRIDCRISNGIIATGKILIYTKEIMMYSKNKNVFTLEDRELAVAQCVCIAKKLCRSMSFCCLKVTSY